LINKASPEREESLTEIIPGFPEKVEGEIIFCDSDNIKLMASTPVCEAPDVTFKLTILYFLIREYLERWQGVWLTYVKSACILAMRRILLSELVSR
jgi:hypothetical protein